MRKGLIWLILILNVMFTLQIAASEQPESDPLMSFLLQNSRSCENALGALDAFTKALQRQHAGPAADPFDFRLAARQRRLNEVAKFYDWNLVFNGELQKSVVIESAYELGPGLYLNVDNRHFWISKHRSEASVAHENKPALLNSLLSTGPSRWLLSIYNSDTSQIDVYGVSSVATDVEVEYLFRVYLFGERLASAPYLSFGPSVIYQGADKHVYAYWFDTLGSGDVEPVFRSQEPLDGVLSNPKIDLTGMLTYRSDGVQGATQIFSGTDWQNYIENLKNFGLRN